MPGWDGSSCSGPRAGSTTGATPPPGRKRPNAWPIGSRRTGATAVSAAESAATVCPGCGALLPADQLDCPACSAPPSPSQARSALLRLIPLTRRRAWAIVLGFLLTVASTAASLVPPYLTQPLVDDVLIPRQASGADVSFHLVWWYLGLMLAAVARRLAAGLGPQLRHGLGERADRRRPAQPAPTST